MTYSLFFYLSSEAISPPLKNCAKIRKKEYEEVKIFVFFYVENVIL